MSDDDDEGSPETATANEELHYLIQQWQKENIDRDIVVVVAGKGGAGKSTLINYFLTLGEDKAAETGLRPTSVTKKVEEYRGEVNGVPIRAIDMPGLHARDHNEDTPAEIVATLIHLTNRKADILIYCIPLNQRLDMVDEKNIRTLNEAFSEIIWKNAVVAFTHADYVLGKQKASKPNYGRVLSEYSEEFQATLQHFGVLAHVTPFHVVPNIKADANSITRKNSGAPIPSETSVDPKYLFTIVGVPTGEEPNNPPKWRQELLSQVINIKLKNIASIIMELKGIRWKEVTDLLEERALEAKRKDSVHKYGSGIGEGVGMVLGTFLGVAFSIDHATPITMTAGLATGTAGGALGEAIGRRGATALYTLTSGMTHPQNQARAEDIAFYIKVNKKLKDLRDRMQE